MWDMNDVINIEYRGGFVYRIIFDDGKSGDIDFSEYVGRGPVLRLLQELFTSPVDSYRKHLWAWLNERN
jgi:hypothetical protein